MSSTTWKAAGRVEPATEAAELNSILLDKLVAGLDPARRAVIVDLGVACGATIDFFSQFRCRLYIEDAVNALTEHPPLSTEGDSGTEEEDDGAAFQARLDRHLLPHTAGEADALLCWDCFNYLARPQLSRLAKHIAPWLRPGGHLHAFVSSHATMPPRPGRFRVFTASNVGYEPAAGPARPAPRYHQLDLGRLMPQFAVERSVLLRSGLQEYLLIRR